ncbi:hypothetical protein JKF63_03804 [Porcisia hertigi]|uniref:Uncharacterized protein n=1 Tax=Porcisia hertigi TaxID=2761500 RepID=A0A836L7D7_9TRYP|nr:hypothetical protein JKF63_03804 [Porcisia hertigi]
MQQPYNIMADAAAEAYVDLRVCDLQVHEGNMPKGLDGGLQINGLYVVLRCQDEVRRTSCLWSDASGALDGAYAEQDKDDLLWNELFRLAVPPAMPPSVTAAKLLGPHAPLSSHLDNSHGTFSTPYIAASPSSTPIPASSLRSAAAQMQFSGSNSSTTGVTAEADSPLFYPSIEIELWRSTPLSENLLSRYTYHVPLELMQAGYDLNSLDAVVERMIPLETKEAQSIMGNLYGWRGHRLTLRLRVQAVGLAPLVSAWSPWQGSKAMMKTAANMFGTGAYPFPPSTEMAGGTMTAASLYAETGVYGAPMGTLNPVLANLLAPFGVSTGVGTVGHTAPSMMTMMPVPGGVGGDNLHKPSQPPLFSVLPSAPASAAMVGGGMFYPHAPRVQPTMPQTSSGQGILGDGDLAWQSNTAQPTVYPSYGPPQQQYQNPH